MKKTINKLKKYFKIEELVGPEIIHRYGDNAWFLFSPFLLETILFIREIKGLPMIVNNWHVGGSYSQRGFRSNIQSISKRKTENHKLYTSGHIIGQAVDFNFQCEHANETRKWILSIANELPYKIRLEEKLIGPMNWVHLDVKYFEKNPKVAIFKV